MVPHTGCERQVPGIQYVALLHNLAPGEDTGTSSTPRTTPNLPNRPPTRHVDAQQPTLTSVNRERARPPRP